MVFASYPLSQFKSHKKEILDSIKNTLDSGNYILGNQVTLFEKNFSKYCDVKYAVGVNSGTDAILLSLKALNIGPGDEVITVSHTALATLSAIISSGATPVIVDIEKTFFTMDPLLIKKAISKKTKAIIPVHIYGQACNMKEIMKIANNNNLFVIEDCAQATGAEYNGKKIGSIGHIGAFSFYPTKNLGAIGDGGMVVTKNKKIANRIAQSRQFGWDDSRNTIEPGQSSRLDEIQAAILNVKLKYLSKDNNKRIRIANTYESLINNKFIELPKQRKNIKHVHHLYVVLAEHRDEFINRLKKDNIFCGIHYPVPGHLHGGYDKYCKIPNNNLPVTNYLASRVLTLPMYPELKLQEAKKISLKINNITL